MKLKTILPHSAFACMIAILLLCTSGCGRNKDTKRIKALNGLPVLYESTVLPAVNNDPDPDAFFPMDDAYDPNLAEAMHGDHHTENYIPAAVFALTPKAADDDKFGRPATIKVGDKVSVLAEADNGNKKTVYLVRTDDNTYCWLYPYHLQDKDGNRLEEMK